MANPKRSYSIGIDIGGTKVLTALVDAQFRILSEIKLKTKPEKGEQSFLKEIDGAVDFVMSEAKVSRKEISGIGVGCPGFVDPVRGTIGDSPNIPFLKKYPLARQISRLTKLPVSLGNDVQTGLFGEHQLGAAKGYANVLGIFMGTGIGGALILNGQLYRGTSGSAGEIGHITVDPWGPRCGCGRYGCLEALAGRLAISAEAGIATLRQIAPHLAAKAGSDLRAIKSGSLAKAASAGDKAIAELIRHKARIVGSAMANLVSVLNPDLIVLGGGVVEAMPGLIVKEAERHMREVGLPALTSQVKVVPAKLGDHSIVLGAAKRASDLFRSGKESQRG